MGMLSIVISFYWKLREERTNSFASMVEHMLPYWKCKCHSPELNNSRDIAKKE
jgi:hypothetical protein